MSTVFNIFQKGKGNIKVNDINHIRVNLVFIQVINGYLLLIQI